jgi:hypothetical protein
MDYRKLNGRSNGQATGNGQADAPDDRDDEPEDYQDDLDEDYQDEDREPTEEEVKEVEDMYSLMLGTPLHHHLRIPKDLLDLLRNRGVTAADLLVWRDQRLCIPKEVRKAIESRKVKALDLLLLWEVQQLAREYGVCWATNRELGKAVGIASPAYVGRHVTKLSKLELLVDVGRLNIGHGSVNSNWHRLLSTSWQPVEEQRCLS